jgi:hypothetical protein
VKIPVPRDLVAALALAGVVGVVASLEVRKHMQAAQTSTIDALEVSSDDIDAMADFARQMEDHAHSPEMQAAVQEFNQLIEELRNKHIDRNEAFRRMAELDLKLQRQSELDRKALDEAMKKLGDELKKNDLSRDVGAALTKGDKKEAEKKLKELATKLRDGKQKISDEQKKALAEALKKASQRDREKSLAEMKASRDKVAAELEKMRAEKEKTGKESAEQERDRKQKERELDRLDREEKAQESGDRQLAKLDRDLDQAADDLLKDLGLSAKDLEAGAEDVNRMAEDEMTEDEKEALRQRLKELHDLLVQQGKLTPEQIAKMRDFVKKAKGGKSGKSGKGKKPGKMGKFDPDGQPEDGDGGDGDDKDGDGGDGDKDGEGKKWTLGPNGERVPIPGAGASPGAGSQPGGQPGDQPGGHQAGVGHDEHVLGAKHTTKVSTIDTQIAGAAAGKGPSKSQTILGAADKGFVGKDYRDVYDKYKTVAEQALKQDEIPAGYRFYVRRYFDLIRPRE